jgi:hypothetical protein
LDDVNAERFVPVRAGGRQLEKARAGRVGSGLLALTLLAGSALQGEAAPEKKPKPAKLEGIVSEVAPAYLTVRSKRGREVRIETAESFEEKVAAGSSVTLWYRPYGDRNELHWFEPPLENAFVPQEKLRREIKKIILLPNSEVPDAEGFFDVLAAFLEENMGWYVAPWILAREIRSRTETPNSMLEFMDPSTGEVNLERLAQSKLQVIRRVAEETRVDAVLELDLLQTKAPTSREYANWDGVTEPISGKGLRALSLFSMIPLGGHVPATTAFLRLRDPQGRLLWSNRRGFAVLAVKAGMGNKFRDRPIPEVLENTDNVQNWLRIVFESFLREASPQAAESSRR